MNNPPPAIDLSPLILETVSVKGMLRVPGQPIIEICRNQPLVQDKEGNIFPLELPPRALDHIDLGVEEELIIIEDKHDGRKKVFRLIACI